MNVTKNIRNQHKIKNKTRIRCSRGTFICINLVGNLVSQKDVLCAVSMETEEQTWHATIKIHPCHRMSTQLCISLYILHPKHSSTVYVLPLKCQAVVGKTNVPMMFHLGRSWVLTP